MEEEFVIYNSNLGVCDFVTIGETELNCDLTIAWLEDPYEMVGPFSLDELRTKGKIDFAACVVMSAEKWRKEQKTLLQEAFLKQQKAQEEHLKEIRRFNQRKQYDDRQYRELLCLPMEGALEVTQIKAAYRKISKRAHPDLGGSHEEFLLITSARDALLEKYLF